MTSVSAARSHASTTGLAAAVVWGALVIGSIIGWRLPVGAGRDINLTVFDVALPLAVAFAFATRRIVVTRLPLKLLAATAAAALLILIHAAYTYRYGAWTPIPRLEGPIQIAGLIRETLKLEIVLIEFSLLVLLFADVDFRRPPVWLLGVLGAVVSGNVVYERIGFLQDNVPYYANIAANTLAGLAVLAISQVWSDRLRDRLIALAWAIGSALIMMIAVRKTYLLVSAITVALIGLVLVRDAARHADPRLRNRIILLLLGLVALVLAAHVAMTYEFYIGRNPIDVLLATGEYSSEVRFDIQHVAVHLLTRAFPIGIGIGQFGALAPRIPEIADFNVSFAHNTILTLITEAGLVGCVLAAGLLALIYLACRDGHWVPRVSRLIYLVVPMMLNDTHGLRMTILVLAFFVTVHLVEGRGGDDCGSAAKTSRG